MRHFYCENIDEKLVIYTVDNNGNKKIISTNRDDIAKGLNNLAFLSTFVELYTKDIVFVCEENQISIKILDFEAITSDANNKDIKDCISLASSKGYIRKGSNIYYSKPQNASNNYVVKQVASLVLAGCISVFSLSPFHHNVKSTDKSNNEGDTNIKITEIMRVSPKQLDNTDDKDITPEIITDIIDQIDEESKEEGKDETNIKPLIGDNINKKEVLVDYFNTDSIDKVNSFLSEFVTTMASYGVEYSLDDIATIFFDVSKVPLDKKIEHVKSAFNLTDDEIDAVAATLVAEGVGWGEKYIDVYAATTTALNHLQFPICANYISSIRGEELGHSIYGHTCYTPQFNTYGSNNYYTFLGNRTITGYKAVVDTLYINSIYGLVLHDYIQFRGAWIDVPGGKIYEDGGNKYMQALNPEDRINELINKNSTI